MTTWKNECGNCERLDFISLGDHRSSKGYTLEVYKMSSHSIFEFSIETVSSGSIYICILSTKNSFWFLENTWEINELLHFKICHLQSFLLIPQMTCSFQSSSYLSKCSPASCSWRVISYSAAHWPMLGHYSLLNISERGVTDADKIWFICPGIEEDKP